MIDDHTTNDSLIHMRVPRALKTRWVRQSQAESLTLTEWIIKRVEGDKKPPDKQATELPKPL